MNDRILQFLRSEAAGNYQEGTKLSPNPTMYRQMNHYHWSNQIIERGVDGDFVELGCYAGGTSKLLGLVMEWKKSDKTLHLYDSFEGLPEPSLEDVGDNSVAKSQGGFPKGIFSTQIEKVEKVMTGICNYEIYPGWFSETIPSKLPDKICYAHLDGDFYSSMLESLEGVYPRLSSGAICVIDDYDNGRFPGVNRATDEFMKDKPEEVQSMYLGSKTGTIQGFFIKS